MRSLARSSGLGSRASSSLLAGAGSVPRYDDPFYEHDDDNDGNDDRGSDSSDDGMDTGRPLVDGVQQQAALSRNDDPAAARPVDEVAAAGGGGQGGELEDLEQGIVASQSR